MQPGHFEGTEPMKTEIITLSYTSLLTVLVAFTTGCATPALWKQTARREWTPNPPDQLLFVESTDHQHDVVVLFRQFADGTPHEAGCVGWQLGQPSTQLALGYQAIQLLTNTCPTVQTIPLYSDTADVPAETGELSPGYGIWNPTDQHLTLYLSEISTNPMPLPTSHQERRTALRICALPLAVAADAALMGAALFVVGLSNCGFGYVGP
jgi:hypothetical protein